MADKKTYKRVLLAYSGGLDTSIIIPWLKENYGCAVVCCAADVGQGEELAPLHEKAKKTGAEKLYIEDLRKEFVEDFIWPTLKAGAIYEGKYLLGTSFARPLIAKRLVEIAEKEGCGRHLPRLHRQGQRSGAFRAVHQGVCARACRSSRRGASGISRPAKRRSSMPTRAASPCPVKKDRPLFDGSQHLASLSRGLRSGGSGQRAAARSAVDLQILRKTRRTSRNM